jgi:DNA-binding response OmpR family regulator
MNIVYVEDDPKAQQQMTRFLRQYGHHVRLYDNIHGAQDAIIQQPPDILLCDYRLGDGPNGLTLAEKVRNLYPDCVIVMVSSYTNTENVTDALRMGLDDYITRPLPLEELYRLMMNAFLRRRGESPQNGERLTQGALQLDRARRIALWRGEELVLTPTEFALLNALVSHVGKVMTTVDLCALAKGDRVDFTWAGDLLKQHIFILRKKLEQGGKYPRCIENVRGVGYKWVDRA